ncbi:MAG: hypothetical protein ACK5YR_13705, partial [Pirellula sp.]
MLDNGQWILNVYAKDNANNVRHHTTPIFLDGNYKPGTLSLAFTDLDLATPDVPIKVQRSYSSARSTKELDFGRGWALDFGIPKIEVAYSQSAATGSSGYPVLLDGTRINVVLPDGSTEGFTFYGIPEHPNPIGINISWLPYFAPDKGNTTFLQVDKIPMFRVASGDSFEYVSFQGAESFHPASRAFGGSWQLFLQDGTAIHIDARTPNTAWIEDRNKNRTTITPNGVTHWSGRTITIQRDSGNNNRISWIKDALNNYIYYTYDNIGNLIKVKDRANAETLFAYHNSDPNVDGKQYLLKTITDPAGREQLAATYNSERRLTTLKDVENFSTGYSYDIRSRVQNVDLGQNSTTDQSVIMDRRGNPVKSVDAAGVQQLNRYDKLGNIIEQRIAVGTPDNSGGVKDDLVTTYSYNEFGQPVTVTDARGNASHYAYDNKLHVVTNTYSPDGLSTRYDYDSNGNLLKATNPNGDSTLLGYLTRGQVGAVKNQEGLELVKNEYNTQGMLAKTTSVDGHVTRMEYDSNGRQTARVGELKNADGSPLYVRNETVYDSSDRVVSTRLVHRVSNGQGGWIDTVQWSTETIYDSKTGKVIREKDQRGLWTDTFYDRRGNVIQTVRQVQIQRTANANGTGSIISETVYTSQWTVYDDQGRVVLSTDTIPITLTNNLPASTSPSVAANVSVYDNAGRVVATQRVQNAIVRTVRLNGQTPLANIPGNNYDLKSEIVQAGSILSTTATEYDSAGRAIRSRDSNGLWTETYYGFAGEVIQTRSQSRDSIGNTVWMVSRSAVDSLGRTIVSADSVQEGTALANGTRTFYDEMGRTFKTERRSGIQLTLLDRFGAVVREPNVYDGPFQIRIDNEGLNPNNEINLISRSLSFYNGKGQLIRSVSNIGSNPATHPGIETLYQYDSRGRQYRQIGHPISTVDSTEKIRLVTETEYDSQGRAYKSWTNIRGRDVNGEIVLNRQFAQSTTQIYDHLGRVIRTERSDGTQTSVTYDSWGQVIGETDPLGNTKQNSYDANGRLIAVTLPAVPDPLDSDNDLNTVSDSPRFDYGFNWAGSQTLLQDALGRRTHFTFDSSGRQLSRKLPSGLTEQYTYTNLGQVKTHQSFEGIVTESIYDNANTSVPVTNAAYKVGTGRLIEQRYFTANTYNNGAGTPSERWKFHYDSYGRKTKAERFAGNSTTANRTESWQYNDLGQLIQETKPEGIIRYEYDPVTGQKTAMSVAKSSDLLVTDVLERTEYRYNELGWLMEVKVIERNDVTLTTPESTRYGYDLQGQQLRIDKPNGVIQRTEVNSSGSVTRMREFGPDNTPHDLADNPKRSEFLYSLDAAGRRTSMIEKFWLDADNNVNTPDVPKQNAYTWTYDANGKLLSEVLDSFDDAADRTDTFVMDLFGNRRKRTTDKPSTAYVDEVITYLYNADDRITSELLDKQNNGTTDQTTTYAWSGTRQSSKTVVIPSTSTVTQTFSYTLPGMLSRVVTENKNGSNVVTSRTRVDYDYTSTGIRSLSVDWNDANLNNSFATSERTGSVEYLVDSTN